jgi:DNA-binding PadR family transcriptional regulator
MIQELEERTGGVWRPSPGAIYPALALLEDQGLVTATESDGKRRFAITDAGRADVPERPPWDEVTRGIDPVQFQVRDTVAQIAIAAQQVVMAGTDDQRTRAAELLAQTRRGLYALLAEETTADAADASAEAGAGDAS